MAGADGGSSGVGRQEGGAGRYAGRHKVASARRLGKSYSDAPAPTGTIFEERPQPQRSISLSSNVPPPPTTGAPSEGRRRLVVAANAAHAVREPAY